MNQGILAARTQRAFASIENEVRRLGGDLTITTTRGDAAHRQLHTLEAVSYTHLDVYKRQDGCRGNAGHGDD